MDASSSSFLSAIQTSKLLTGTMAMTIPKSSVTPPPSFLSRHLPSLNVSSVRIEENPQKSTTRPTTTRTSRPAPSPTTTLPAAAKPAPSTRKSPANDRRVAAPNQPTMVFNVLEGVINNFIDPPLRQSVDPRYVLSDNFAPVDELPPTECEVIHGSLPSCLDGATSLEDLTTYSMATACFTPSGSPKGKPLSAVATSRLINTPWSVDAGAPLLPNVFSGFNGLAASAARGALSAARILAGQFNPVNGIGLANTSLAYFGNRLYAIGESDLPYAVRLTSNGDIETVGRHDFDGKLMMSMTAHPKIWSRPPFLTYFHFDGNGNKQPDVPIFSMTRPSFIHDFGISSKYAIFADIQIGMNPMEMIFGGGSPVGADPAKGFNLIHAINAWDEEDAIVMLAPNILSVEHTLERMDLIHALVEKVRIDLKTGIVTRNPVSARNLDFGVINPAYLGKKNRFVYAAIGDPMPKISGVVKLDVSGGERQECTVASRLYGPRCYGGEPFFVAREPENPEAEEDDGYVVSYVHDEIAGESKFLVMDAKSPELDIVAAVKLPRRVPYGFHGLFVKESDLKKL
uniref:Carotenoid cleavage dioxygenase 4 n=1 Tax=Salix viminalis TaxID=40686 RepID=A0A6N2LSW7_SALVM